MLWLADDDPTKIEPLERMPLIDYWHLLNRKLAAAEQIAKQQKKLTKRAGNNR